MRTGLKEMSQSEDVLAVPIFELKLCTNSSILFVRKERISIFE